MDERTSMQTARERLLDLAARQGWVRRHDLGLYVELVDGPATLKLTFDQDGSLTWALGADKVSPYRHAMRVLDPHQTCSRWDKTPLPA
jgi:hypothetical protein